MNKTILFVFATAVAAIVAADTLDKKETNGSENKTKRGVSLGLAGFGTNLYGGHGGYGHGWGWNDGGNAYYGDGGYGWGWNHQGYGNSLGSGWGWDDEYVDTIVYPPVYVDYGHSHGHGYF